jgi:hypothetical protein
MQSDGLRASLFLDRAENVSWRRFPIGLPTQRVKLNVRDAQNPGEFVGERRLA